IVGGTRNRMGVSVDRGLLVIRTRKPTGPPGRNPESSPSLAAQRTGGGPGGLRRGVRSPHPGGGAAHPPTASPEAVWPSPIILSAPWAGFSLNYFREILREARIRPGSPW